MAKDKWRQLKVHLVFGGADSARTLIGRPFKSVVRRAFLPGILRYGQGCSAFEWLMIILFWYACAFQRPQNSWTTGEVTTLGLSGRK